MLVGNLSWIFVLGCIISVQSACVECDLDVPETLVHFGYPSETHTVITPDGYTLTMHRIPYSPRAPQTNATRPVVLLQHGLLDSSFTWISNLPGSGLAYILSDAGYDVWMGNNRGNFYSPPVDTPQGWSFSFDEMGLYDLPTFINHAIHVTGVKSIGYVGHSEGTTQAFASFSQLPEVAAKVNMFVALAPATYVSYQTSILITLLADLDLDVLFELFGVKDFFPESGLVKLIGELFCAPNEWSTGICEDIIFSLIGRDTDKTGNLNETRVEIYVGHTPAGTSTQNMAHWAQSVRQGTFGFYDYGSAASNMQHYNQTTPPAYDLSKVNVTMAIFAGGQDDLADPHDVQRLMSELPKDSISAYYYEEEYDHLDFTWGEDAYLKIYPNVIKMLNQGAGL